MLSECQMMYKALLCGSMIPYVHVHFKTLSYLLIIFYLKYAYLYYILQKILAFTLTNTMENVIC